MTAKGLNITKEQLEEYYINQELDMKAIGEIYGCDRKNIDYYLKKYKIPKRSVNETKRINQARKRGVTLTIEQILNHIEEGWLIQDIAAHYNVNRRYISNVLREDGINLRNHENARKRHSAFMMENNPVPKGTPRPEEHLRGIMEHKKIRIGEAELRWETAHLRTYEEYVKSARYLAYRYFDNGQAIPEGLEIDHKYSCRDGYAQGVPLSILSHPFNLRLITPSENRSKGRNSIITLEELYNGTKENS
ncbi:hypothetical protein [Priestia megaterium]